MHAKLYNDSNQILHSTPIPCSCGVSNLEKFSRSLDVIFNKNPTKGTGIFKKSNGHGMSCNKCVTVHKPRPEHAVTFSFPPLVSFRFSLMLSLKAIKL